MIALACFLAGACATRPSADAARGPAIAHHQHLISPDFSPIVGQPPIDAAALLRMMDDAGSRRGVVLSVGYSFADERKGLSEPEARVRQENDWTSAQVMTAPRRLVGFCGVNPLTPGALAEIERCNRLPGMRGVKLHFGNSGVSLRDPAHVSRMREVFALANRLGAPIAAHLRSRGGGSYGAEDAALFIEHLLPQAPDVTVQIAHLAGAGPGHSPQADAALATYIEAIRKGDSRMRRVIFDATTVAAPSSSAEEGALIARRIREIGVERVVFGSDLPIGGNPSLAEGWKVFRAKVPLTDAELSRIAGNVAPYLRRGA
ncbi:amidohydrolase family protein [Phenylobacterium sp.]|uniref:amidohydrolase family protein n=1 Tax=Phenylobacterium sp. TaxID=1871053 RepID=UPI002F91ED9C